MILSKAPSRYVGRFAPSPTGPLHLGSLYTALASYLDARAQGGVWLLRIDDLDTPRNVPGAIDAILRCLDGFGLYWDGEVYYQSQHLDCYQTVLSQLQQAGWIYACRCSRKTLVHETVYPGFCRTAGFPFDDVCAWRLKTQDLTIEFDDALQGKVGQNLARDQGDFIVRRRDGIIAYQFAVIVDDHRQAVNHIVRGVDLLDSTPKQIYQQRVLGYPQPSYLHLPVIIDAQGHKLSKQTLAAPVDNAHPEKTLFLLLQLLRQSPPDSLRQEHIETQLDWAIAHWQPLALEKVRTLQTPTP